MINSTLERLVVAIAAPRLPAGESSWPTNESTPSGLSENALDHIDGNAIRYREPPEGVFLGSGTEQKCVSSPVADDVESLPANGRKTAPPPPFLANVCTHEWNRGQDAGRSFAEGARLLKAEHPDKAELIDAYGARFDEMMPGPIAGSVEILAELRARGTPLYLLSNFSAETFPPAFEDWPGWRRRYFRPCARLVDFRSDFDGTAGHYQKR